MARRALAVLPLLLCVVLLAVTARDPGAMRSWLIGTSYYNAALFALCAVFGARRWLAERPDAPRDFLRRHAAGLVGAGVLCAFVFLSVPPRLRVLPDETVLLSVSRSMTFDKTVEVVAEAQRYFDTSFPENGPFEVQPRPHLFPFCLSVLHSLTGYRVANAYALNFLVLWALLVLAYSWTRELLAESGEAVAQAGGWAAMLAVAAQPVVTLCASSGGFDLMSAFFALFSLRLLSDYLDAPTATGFEALWLALLAVSSVRYEGAVYLAVVVAGLLLLGRLRRDHFEGSAAIALTPVFFLPTVWQRALAAVVTPPPGQVVASPAILLANTAAFVRNAASWDFASPYACWLNLAGLAAAAFFLARRPRRPAALVAAAALLAHWAVVSAFYFSAPGSPSASRYFAVFAAALSGLAVLLAARAEAVARRPWLLVLAAAAAFLLYHSAAVEDRGGRSLALPREYEAVTGFLKDKKDFLIVADMPSLYTASGYGALGFRNAGAKAADLRARLDTRLINDIFVIQEIDLKTGAPISWETLPSELPLETVYELRTRVLSSMRISKVRRG